MDHFHFPRSPCTQDYQLIPQNRPEDSISPHQYNFPTTNAKNKKKTVTPAEYINLNVTHAIKLMLDNPVEQCL